MNIEVVDHLTENWLEGEHFLVDAVEFLGLESCDLRARLVNQVDQIGSSVDQSRETLAD